MVHENSKIVTKVGASNAESPHARKNEYVSYSEQQIRACQGNWSLQ